jgi:glycosyltransferase involved in cell wall biosynthesis
MMDVGLLPALGSGIGDLRRSGQDSRLIDGYLRPYAAAFERVRYFSYLVETLAEYTEDPDVLGSVELLAPARPRARLARALTLPAAHGGALRRCAVLRLFQITGVVPALISRALWGTPYVTTYGFWYSGLSRSRSSRRAKRLLERLALRMAAAVIVTTEELRAHVAGLVPVQRIELIPNGVDTERFGPDAARPTKTRRLLYVGRLSPEKNLATLIAAAAKVSARWPLELTFVGRGPLEDDLRRQAAAAGVALELPGVVDHRALPDWYRGAEIFALPSFTEGHPKVLIEAMASGLACLASDCVGNRSLISDGVTGLLFDPADADALAEQLERLLADPDLGRGLGRAARALVVERYDLRALVGREIALLRHVGSGR